MATQTPFVETEALLAVLNEDEEGLAEILRDMLPSELSALRTASSYLADMCRSAIRIKQREIANAKAADLGDVAPGRTPLPGLPKGWNSSSRAALDIIRRQDDEGGGQR